MNHRCQEIEVVKDVLIEDSFRLIPRHFKTLQCSICVRICWSNLCYRTAESVQQKKGGSKKWYGFILMYVVSYHVPLLA